jgi:hypothetical protein
MAKNIPPIEGEPLKRFRISYWGSPVGSYDTAKEVWDAYQKHKEIQRPIIDPKRKGGIRSTTGPKKSASHKYARARPDAGAQFLDTLSSAPSTSSSAPISTEAVNTMIIRYLAAA